MGMFANLELAIERRHHSKPQQPIQQSRQTSSIPTEVKRESPVIYLLVLK
jgi:hypothetical protein